MRWTTGDVLYPQLLNYLAKPAHRSIANCYTVQLRDPGNPLVFPLNAVRWLTHRASWQR